MGLYARFVEVNLSLHDPHVVVQWAWGSARWEFASSDRTRLLRVLRHYTWRKPPEGATLVEALVEKLRGSARPLTAPEAPRKPTTGRYWLSSMPGMTTFDSYPEALEAAQASALSNPGRPFLICSVHSEVEYKRDGHKHLLSW